jgi:hypothetical protein
MTIHWRSPLLAAGGTLSRIGGAIWRIWSRRRTRRTETVWPYVSQKRIALAWRILLVLGFAFFCFLYGAAFALLAPYLVVPLVALLVPLALLVIWALPNVRRPPLQLLQGLFYASLITMVMWPNYLAIALPFMPWITVQRLVGVPFAILLLICLSVSLEFRRWLAAIMSITPWIRNLFFVFLGLEAFSIGFSGAITDSIDRFIVAQTNWTAVFVAGCFIFSKEGEAERMARLLWLMSIALGILGLWEFSLGHAPWVGHIPSFLKINDPSVAVALQGTTRGGGVHRVQTTYTTALGFAEFLAIAFPFVLHFAVNSVRPAVRIAAILSVLFLILIVVISQARVGYVGFFITVVAYPMAWTAYNWRLNNQNLLASAAVYLSPVFIGLAGAMLFLVPGIRIRVLGGGAVEASNQGRIDQINMGIPKIFSHPWGYGMGEGADVLGYYTPGGQLTIDSYYLRLALEFGVIGLAVYMALFAAAIFYSGKAVLSRPEGDRAKTLLIPIVLSLLSYIVIKSADAAEDNQAFAFAIMGMVSGLLFRFSDPLGRYPRILSGKLPSSNSKKAAFVSPATMETGNAGYENE